MIVGIDGLSDAEIRAEIDKGAKFVYFEYAVSVLIMSFKRPTDVHFIRAGEGTFGKAIGPSLITLLFGWWGIPWGPIYSFMALFTNLTGGKDVTNDMYP